MLRAVEHASVGVHVLGVLASILGKTLAQSHLLPLWKDILTALSQLFFKALYDVVGGGIEYLMESLL